MSTPSFRFIFFLLGVLTSLLPFSSSTLVNHDESFSPDYVLRVTTQNATFNCESRFSALVNGSSPGPTLRLKEGKTTWIRVYNDMTSGDNLTMHWHGLSMSSSPFSDGSPQASQWPIPSSHFFDYEIHPEVGEAGTYFYHSHVGFQAISAQGALIVEEAEAVPYEYDDEKIIILSDYYNKTDKKIIDGLIGNPFVWSGEANAILFNGQSGQNSAGKDSTCAPAVLEVEPGKTYRLRFIGGTAISFVSLGFEGHDCYEIIEADGSYTKPYGVDHLQIASGQRFSVLLRTKTEEELKQLNQTQFWIQYENRERPANVTGYALLSYKTGYSNSKSLPAIPSQKPITLPTTVYDWLEYALTPLNPDSDPFPTADTVTRRVTISVEILQNGSARWTQNYNTWVENKTFVPYLVDIYQRGQAAIPDYNASVANGGWDPKTLAFPAKIGEVIELVWENTNSASGGWDFHPFHSHNKHFWDLGSGNGTYNATANEERLRDFIPAKRDTTVLHRYATTGVPHTTSGWRAWRFKVRNPGVWMMHCHILQHMIMGMQTAWVFGDANDILATYPPKAEVSGYLTYGGSAYGNATYTPTVMHAFDS